MKRTIKKVAILILCTVLLFASVHSIYSSTVMPDVQAAEAMIAAEVGATVIEYLWGLLLTMGLVETVDTWYERMSVMDTALDSFYPYPAITEGMAITATVGTVQQTVTYEQYRAYIKDNLARGSSAAQAGQGVFTVLQGGGGTNSNGNGNNNHNARITAGFVGALFATFFMALGDRWNIQNFIINCNEYFARLAGREMTDEEAAALQDAYEHLAPVETLTDGSTMTLQDNIWNNTTTFRFQIDKAYDGTVLAESVASANNLFVGVYGGGINFSRPVRQLLTEDSNKYDVLLIAPFHFEAVNGKTMDFLIPIVAQFASAGSAYNAFNEFDFYEYKIYPYAVRSEMSSSYLTAGADLLPETGLTESRFRDLSADNYTYPIYQSAGNGSLAFAISGDGNIFYQSSDGLQVSDMFMNTHAGEHDVNTYFRSYGKDVMPLVVLDNIGDVAAVCDYLLQEWDLNVFSNYKGRITPAYQDIPESALSELAEAMLFGNAGTDAVIQAAEAVDTLREVEPIRLPEFYPDVYPEYLPETLPEEYPDIYPDYDPVTNPHPDPAVPPDPYRVVINVVQNITNPQTNPNPDKDPAGENGDWDLENWNPDWDLEDVSFNLADYFPFCIPFDLIHAFKLLTADAQAPYWEFPIHAELFGIVIDYTFVIDMSKFESLAKIFRTCETIGFCVGLILITRNIIRG